MNEVGKLGLFTGALLGAIACADAPPGSASTSSQPPAPDAEAPPVGVIESLEATGSSVCAILSNGSLRCWGDNADDQLGLGPSDGARYYKPTVVPGIIGVQQLVLNSWYSCARFAAPGAPVACWGSNVFGDLGNGQIGGGSVTPVDVIGLSHPIVDTEGVCALHDDGRVSCWAKGELSELDSVANVVDLSFRSALESNGRAVRLDSELKVAFEAHFPKDSVEIRWGNETICVRTQGGDLWCAGRNEEGQFGTGMTDPIDGAAKVPVSGVRQFDLDYDGHACAVLQDGTLSCWGNNLYGQVGDGDPDFVRPPQLVPGLTNVRQVNVGFGFTCALREEPREILCWGVDDFGALGVGPQFEPVLEPTPVLWDDE